MSSGKGTSKPEWSAGASAELYGVGGWGSGFFGVSEKGHVEVRSEAAPGRVDLRELVRDLEGRGLRTPLLLRFSDVLAGRMQRIMGVFEEAVAHYGYRGRHRGVYPIKVNQQRQVVDEVVEFGRALGFGLEVGSKPELLIALAVLDTPDAYLICNGFKDRAYVELALLGQQLGRNPVLVIDRRSELRAVIETAQELRLRPRLGLRARLQSEGAGRWEGSTGDRSKFGLSAAEMVEAVKELRACEMLDCLELLHFHIGSQITDIRAHKEAFAEGSRIFVGLHALGARPRVVDVGGGLAVDYDGSQKTFQSSKNYTMQEYANDVVSFLQEACDEADIEHPDIITEAGRALVAHHALLVFDVLDVDEVPTEALPEPVAEGDPKLLHDFTAVLSGLCEENFQEAWHDALQLKEETGNLFSLGYLDLEGRARAERLFWCCCAGIQAILRSLPEVPEEFEDIERVMADTYYGNLSIFQSAPDHWAVQQLFPVMPIHRLDEEPTRRGVFADLTCDSDGKIDRFVGQREARNVLELHPFTGEPYYVAVFLVGAYQEILGDLHNLFGDTDAVHVRFRAEGGYTLEHVVEGDRVEDVLEYVQYERKALGEQVRRTTERALREGRMSIEEATRLRGRYAQGLEGSTYLSSRG